MKTAELTGAALDWAVAKCEGEDYSPAMTYSGIGQEYPATNYCTNWAQGGPIIERMFAEGLEMRQGEPTAGNQRAWARLRDGRYYSACTPLIAAMRCFVASKLGNDIDIPKELQ